MSGWLRGNSGEAHGGISRYLRGAPGLAGRQAGGTHSRVCGGLELGPLDPGVDAVVITTPNHLHAEQTERSLRAGKHVLCEIPPALSLEDAQRVTRVSRSENRRLMVAHMVDAILWITQSSAAEVFCRIGPLHQTQGVMNLTLSMALPRGEIATIAQSYGS